MSDTIDRKEAAKMLDISLRTLDRYVQKGILKGKKEGRKIVFDRHVVESMQEQESVQAQVIRPAEKPEKKEKKALTTGKDVLALTQFLEKMQGVMQEKDKHISELHYELGKYKERVEHSVPLLESRDMEDALQEREKNLRQVRFLRTLFAALFLIALVVIAFLVEVFGVFEG